MHRWRLMVLGVLVLASGCATVSESGYFWGNHAQTYYAYAKAPSPETLQAHIAELQQIVTVSNERSLKVPPGIYAELGYFTALADKSANSAGFYAQEMALYPESKIFLNRLTAGDNR